jgi:hypothetical protein
MKRAAAAVEKLQGFVKDLTSHVVPFIALREMAAHNGPIYEFRTGRKSLVRSSGHIEKKIVAKTFQDRSVSPQSDSSEATGQMMSSVSLRPVRPKPPRQSSAFRITTRSETLPLGATASEEGPSDDIESKEGTVQASQLSARKRWDLVFDWIRYRRTRSVGDITSSDIESREYMARASNIIATERWKAASDRIRLWSRIRSVPDAQFLMQYLHSPLKSRATLRLLKLLPTPFGEIIKCELFQVTPRNLSLEGPMTWVGEPFEAISWLWSREKRDRTMCIFSGLQWRYLDIPRSLDACLKALRLDDKPRLLWIDYLCSDRSDNQELENLPRLFYSIFAAAENVCVWLGERSQDSDLVMDSIRQSLANLTVPDSLDQEMAFLQRPWFSRRWTIQEVAWARRCQVYCGQQTISWNELSDWISLLAHYESSKGFPNLLQTNLNHWHAFRLVEIQNNVFRQGVGNGDRKIHLVSLEYLVTSFSYFKVSMPYDVVYALLSLAARESSKSQEILHLSNASFGAPLVHLDKQALRLVGYRVDYDQRYDEFCKYFIQFCINSSSSLDIICRPWAPDVDALSPTDPLREKGLPSWISTMKRAPQAQYQRRLHSRSDLQWRRINGDNLARLTSSTTQKYMASGASKIDFNSLRFRKYETLFSMYVQGFVLGNIQTTTVASQLGSIPSEWASFVVWKYRSQHPPEEYWRTLVADQSMSGLGAPKYYPRLLRELYSWVAEGSDILAEDMAQASVSSSIMEEFVQKVQATIWNRALARISQNNALALVPRDAQKGDLICILYGCSVPVVLRRRLKTKKEIWEQRKSAMYEEDAAVYVQRRYREILLHRSFYSSKASPRSHNKLKILIGSNLDKFPYVAISVIFLSFLRILPVDLPPWFKVGLFGVWVLALWEIYRIQPASSSRSKNLPAGATTARSSARPPRPLLTLSKPAEPHNFSLVGECYIHGMMDGEAIFLQDEQKIRAETFELV